MRTLAARARHSAPGAQRPVQARAAPVSRPIKLTLGVGDRGLPVWPVARYSKRCTSAAARKIPDATFSFFDGNGKMREITTAEVFDGKKVVLFAVPGAFLPTCSMKHLPGFVAGAAEMRGRGVDTVACVSVNDAFVMDAWAKSLQNSGRVLMLADGGGAFTHEMGVELDLSGKGVGIRSRRYSLIADDRVIKVLHLEEGGAFTVSSAENLMQEL